jgi:hypothetical protein
VERIPVSSSDIASIGYEAETLTLEVEFLSGRIYQYFGVPVEVYEAFMNAGSYGRFFHYNIKNRYPYNRLT